MNVARQAPQLQAAARVLHLQGGEGRGGRQSCSQTFLSIVIPGPWRDGGRGGDVPGDPISEERTEAHRAMSLLRSDSELLRSDTSACTTVIPMVQVFKNHNL